MNNQTLFILGAGLIPLVILNLIATYVIFHTYFKVKSRRAYQIIFIWLVPLIGAMLAIYLNREDKFAPKSKRRIGNQTSNTNDQAIDFALSVDDHVDR